MAFKLNTHYSIPLISGLVAGYVIIYALTLPDRWAISLILSLFGLCALCAFIKDIESIIYSCFILSLSYQVGKSFFYVPYAGGGHELRINLPEILFALLIVICALGSKIRLHWEKCYILILLSACSFVLISFLSVIKAIDIRLSIFELIRVLIAIAIFAFVPFYINSRDKLRKTIFLLTIGMVPHLCGGLYQWMFKEDLGLKLFGEMAQTPDLWPGQAMMRVGGLVGHPNAFGTYLVITLPFFILFWRRKSVKIRLFSSLTFAAGILALIATQSRGAWLGFGVGGTIAFSIFLVRASKLGLSRTCGTLTLISILSVATLISTGLVEKRLFLEDSGSAASRIPMMVDAVKIIEANPLLGIGINNYTLAVPAYDTTGIHREWHATTVHNLFLLIAAESGILALLSFALFWILILLYVSRLLKSSDINYFLLGLTFTASIVGFFVIHQVDPNYRFYPAVQREIWFLAGLVVASTRLSLKHDHEIESSE